MSDKHPLEQTTKPWLFSQPNLGIEAQYVSIDKSGKRQLRKLRHLSTCREGVISNARKALQQVFCTKNRYGDRAWDFSFEQSNDLLDLADPQAREAGRTRLLINTADLARDQIPQFLDVSDYLVGNVCVLLNPNGRIKGDWWKTDPKKCMASDDTGKNIVAWNGSDNFFLYHPALIGLVTGLYRQAFLLTKAGFGEEILAAVEREAVDEALSGGSWRKALANCKKLRTWIEVYTPGGNYVYNFPFPQGYWLRFMRLQQALRGHTYEEVFEQDFVTAWNLLSKDNDSNWSGMYSFWGGRDGDQYYSGDAHKQRGKHLMQLGKPSGNKPATSTT
jgi:hypothetical protein